jgi:hypothetical protein
VPGHVRARAGAAAASIAVASVLVAFAGGCSSDSDRSAPSAVSAPRRNLGAPVADDDLVAYVQRATGGSASVNASGTGLLTLTGVEPDTVHVTNRAGHVSDRIPTDRFVRDWSRYGFGAVAPDATLTVAGDADSMAVRVLGDPTWSSDGSTVTYAFRLAEDATTGLPPSFGAATLAVDGSDRGPGRS